MILLKVSRKVKRGRWDEYVAVTAKVDARYAELGIPQTERVRCRPMFGGGMTDTWVSLSKWPSLRTLEESADKLAGDEQMRVLRAQLRELTESNAREIYDVLEA